MQALHDEKATYESNAKYFEYLSDYIKQRENYTDVVAPSVIGIQDNLLNDLISTTNKLNLQLRNLNFSLYSDSPQTALLKEQIKNTRISLQENLRSLIESNNIGLQNIQNQVKEVETEIKKLPSTERQLINIQREFTINDQIYTFLLQKRAEAGITKASNTSNHKTLDSARKENTVMVKPQRTMNNMMALTLGGVVPLFLIILIEFLNTKIVERKYVEGGTKVPILGTIGHSEKELRLPVYENPESALDESVSALRANLQFILSSNNGKVISVTSTISGEGKTFCSVNLATILAMTGKNTLLVSLDLRRPKVHRLFGIDNSVGLSNYLVRKCTIDEIIHKSDIENLDIAISGPIPPNPSELIGSQRMIDFIEHAKTKYEYVVIDTPPIAIVSDAMLLKDQTDVNIYIIRHAYTQKQVLGLINDLHLNKGLKSMGIVINDVQVRGYYGYSYRYDYKYGYGYGYNYGGVYYNDEVVKRNIWGKIVSLIK